MTHYILYIKTLFWRWWYRNHPTPSKYSKDEALEIAKKHKMETAVSMAILRGYTPDNALQEYDLFPYEDHENHQ